MSPEAIHSLIELFGVEKGLQILNLFTALDDTEITQQRQSSPGRKQRKGLPQDLGISAGAPVR
ncbi:MAG: hypothetical protein QGI83_18110 [Candidatus Latescibacteria bacterium]|nr:hypothetical protein [Candidatus Latescibacterota bacterium]